MRLPSSSARETRRRHRPRPGRRFAAHHHAQLVLIQHVGEGQRLGALRGDVQIGHHAVHVAGGAGRDDGAVVVDLELEIRAKPRGKAAAQLDVVAGQLRADIVAVGRHDAGGAHRQVEIRAFGQGNVRQGLVAVHHPAAVHVVQRAVGADFGDELVQPVPPDPGSSTPAKCPRRSAPARPGSPPAGERPERRSRWQAHLVVIVDKGIDLALGHGQISRGLVVEVQDLRFGKLPTTIAPRRCPGRRPRSSPARSAATAR